MILLLAQFQRNTEIKTQSLSIQTTVYILSPEGGVVNHTLQNFSIYLRCLIFLAVLPAPLVFLEGLHGFGNVPVTIKPCTHSPIFTGSSEGSAVESADSTAESADSTTDSVMVRRPSLSKMFNILNLWESADGNRPTIAVGRPEFGPVGTGLKILHVSLLCASRPSLWAHHLKINTFVFENKFCYEGL